MDEEDGRLGPGARQSGPVDALRGALTGARTGPLAVSVLSDLISRVTDAVLEEVPEVAEPTGSDAGAIIAAARAGSTGGRQGEEVGFATDSPVEGDGFEPSVPERENLSLRAKGDVQAAHTARTRVPKRSTGAEQLVVGMKAL